MPRKVIFTNGECYHVCNRGVDKREVFGNQRDYERFLLSMDLLNDEKEGLMGQLKDIRKTNPGITIESFSKTSLWKRDPLVEIIAYCLNPNHYHFILRQLQDRGIENFMHRIGISHTKYFNKKNDRSGALFQGVFKAIHIDSNEYLLYLSAYVNKNNYIHGYNNENISWQYSSLPDYLGDRDDAFVKKDIILGQFKDAKEYKNFVDANAEYMKNKKDLEKYLLD